MAHYVNGSALNVGDVILDRDATNDTHPYVVVSRSAYHFTLRNCTSFESSALVLIRIAMADKTGDGNWSGKDSYVVKSSVSLDLPYQYLGAPVVEPVPVEVLAEGPANLLMFMGPNGPFPMFVYPTATVLQPRLVRRYADCTYRVVGTIMPARMAQVVQELDT